MRIGSIRRVTEIQKGCFLTVVGRQKADQATDFTKAQNVIVRRKMGNTAFTGVDIGAAKGL